MSTESSAPKTGVVRGTLHYASGFVWGMYSRAEQISVVRSTLNLTKPLIPVVEPVVHRVVAVADPWVDSVDTVVTGAWKTVHSRVVEPARQVQEVATIQLKNRYAALLDLSDQAVDILLPEKETSKMEEKEQPKTLVQVRSKAQKRIMKRLDTQWNNARAFSAGRLKEIIHVDLIEYAANGYALSVSLLQKNVLPIVNDLSARGTALTAYTSSVYVSVRTASAEKSKLLWDAIARLQEISYQRYTEAYKFASQRYTDAYKFASIKADEYGVPVIVGKAKEVSLGEVSDFVLVKLNIKNQNEQFVVVERKLFDLFRTLLGLIIKKDSNTPAKQGQAASTKQAAAVH